MQQITKQEFIEIAKLAAEQFGYDVLDFGHGLKQWQVCSVEVNGIDVDFTQLSQSNDVKTLLRVYLTWKFSEFYLNQNKNAIDNISKCLINIKASAEDK